LGEVDFDFLRSSARGFEKEKVEPELTTAGLVGAVEGGVVVEVAVVFELRELLREGEEVRESERCGRERFFAVRATILGSECRLC